MCDFSIRKRAVFFNGITVRDDLKVIGIVEFVKISLSRKRLI